MKTNSLILAAVLAVASLAGPAFGQTVQTSYQAPQKLNGVVHLAPDGFTATAAVVQVPKFIYDPATATATATITVTFYKDAAAITSHLRPADFKGYTLTASQTSTIFSSSAITGAGNSTLNVAVNYLLTLGEYSGASKIQ